MSQKKQLVEAEVHTSDEASEVGLSINPQPLTQDEEEDRQRLVRRFRRKEEALTASEEARLFRYIAMAELMEKEDKIKRIEAAEEEKTKQLEALQKEEEKPPDIDKQINQILNIQIDNFFTRYESSGKHYLEYEREYSKAEKQDDNGEALRAIEEEWEQKHKDLMPLDILIALLTAELDGIKGNFRKLDEKRHITPRVISCKSLLNRLKDSYKKFSGKDYDRPRSSASSHRGNFESSDEEDLFDEVPVRVKEFQDKRQQAAQAMEDIPDTPQPTQITSYGYTTWNPYYDLNTDAPFNYKRYEKLYKRARSGFIAKVDLNELHAMELELELRTERQNKNELQKKERLWRVRHAKANEAKEKMDECLQVAEDNLNTTQRNAAAQVSRYDSPFLETGVKHLRVSTPAPQPEELPLPPPPNTQPPKYHHLPQSDEFPPPPLSSLPQPQRRHNLHPSYSTPRPSAPPLSPQMHPRFQQYSHQQEQGPFSQPTYSQQAYSTHPGHVSHPPSHHPPSQQHVKSQHFQHHNNQPLNQGATAKGQITLSLRDASSLKISKFSGGNNWPREWGPFWRGFKPIVHDQNFPDEVKLAKLLDQLSGPALDTIAVAGTSSMPYDKAIEKLHRKYNNTAKVQQFFLGQLEQVRRPQANSVAAQKSYFEEIEKLKAILADSGIDGPAMALTLKQNMNKNISDQLLKDILKHLGKKSLLDVDDLDLLFTTWEDEISYIDRGIPEEMQQTHQREDHSFTGLAAPHTWTPQVHCYFCESTNHFSVNCDVIKSSQDRYQFVKKNFRCQKCLGKHLTWSCTNPRGGCRTCKNPNHHTAQQFC